LLRKNNFNTFQILPLSFLLAFCSFFYELCFAQLLSSLLGGTYLQYAISIGLFTFSLGMGTLVYEKIKHSFNYRNIFIIIEVFIVCTVLISPWIMIMISNRGFDLLLYLPLIIVGVSTGIELPLLINQDETLFTKTLAIDYIGMIFASIAFPIYFFPQIGILPSIYIVSLINLFSISFLFSYKNHKIIFSIIILAFMTFLIFNIDTLNHLSSYFLELRHV
jgi:spermidine synthase